MLARAGKGHAYTLAGRRHARWLRNASPLVPHGPSRHHIITGKPLDFTLSTPMPLIWGCDCIILNDEIVRSQKGSGDSKRTADGEWIGIDGASNIVRKLNGQIVRRVNVKPLNELQLALSGLPGQIFTEEAETNTEGENLGSHPPLKPIVKQAPAPPTKRPKVEGLKVGDEIDVWYLPEKSSKKARLAAPHELGQWYRATITGDRNLDNGARHHLVAAR